MDSPCEGARLANGGRQDPPPHCYLLLLTHHHLLESTQDLLFFILSFSSQWGTIGLLPSMHHICMTFTWALVGFLFRTVLGWMAWRWRRSSLVMQSFFASFFLLSLWAADSPPADFTWRVTERGGSLRTLHVNALLFITNAVIIMILWSLLLTLKSVLNV